MLKRKNQMSHVSCHMLLKKGFTLVELLTVIAIIGILASVVIVNMTGATAKAKRASALTTAASVLPELVTCEDDGGDIRGPSNNSTGGGFICYNEAHLGAEAGHTAEWPSLAKTGWTYGTTGTFTDNTLISTMTYKIIKPASSSLTDIECFYAKNGCE